MTTVFIWSNSTLNTAEWPSRRVSLWAAQLAQTTHKLLFQSINSNARPMKFIVTFSLMKLEFKASFVCLLFLLRYLYSSNTTISWKDATTWTSCSSLSLWQSSSSVSPALNKSKLLADATRHAPTSPHAHQANVRWPIVSRLTSATRSVWTVADREHATHRAPSVPIRHARRARPPLVSSPSPLVSWPLDACDRACRNQ